MANHVVSRCNIITELAGLSWWPCVWRLDSTAAPRKLPLQPGGIDENRSWNWLDGHNLSTDHSSQWKQRSTMNLVFDSMGPPHQSPSASSRPSNTPTSSLALPWYRPATGSIPPFERCPGLNPEERACIAHFRPLPKCPSHIVSSANPTGVMHNRLQALLHAPSHSSSICKAHTYPLRPASKDRF